MPWFSRRPKIKVEVDPARKWVQQSESDPYQLPDTEIERRREARRTANVARASVNPMGKRFYALRDALGGNETIDTTERQGPCRTALTNLHGRQLAERQSNAKTRFVLKVRTETRRVEVKDDRYLIGFLDPRSAEAFRRVVGEEKVWVWGRLRYRPEEALKFTADLDWTIDHEGTAIF